MADERKLTRELHREQIEKFIAVRSAYETYANALRRALEKACRVSFPEALAQARAKTVSSFAEKVARKFDKYPDAVNQFTDLCGARVIVQTVEQVRAVRRFLEANFEIVESDDKGGVLLEKGQFGYRDMHYIVRLKADRAGSLGFTAGEQETIGDKRAEIQVRTWLQHAWADTLHDRMYKNRLKLSTEVKRTGALLAALMEEGDRNFNVLADDLDRLIANYTASATRDDVLAEIDTQRVILDNEREDSKKPGLALKLARLLAGAGENRQAVEALSGYAETRTAERCELLLELGDGLCRLHREAPKSAEYQRGRRCLEEAAGLCSGDDGEFVPHLRKRESLRARAWSRLGWALTALAGEEPEARRCYSLAHGHEPSNPYHLAGMLGFELRFGQRESLLRSMRTTIHGARDTCLSHAAAEIELPFAYFTAGRLSLLLDAGDESLSYYARGIRHCLERRHCAPADILEDEAAWVRGVYFGVDPPAPAQRVLDLLALGSKAGQTRGAAAPAGAPTAVVAGGADGLAPEMAGRLRPLLKEAFARFRGTVISGGTTSGVPAAMGDAAGELSAEGARQFRLIGYRPGKLGDGVSAHGGYDEHRTTGDDFSADQILRYWRDLFDAGVNPKDVLVLGIGGGEIAALEYRIALAFGASLGLAAGSGGAAAGLVSDPLWSGVKPVYELPLDAATLRAFVMPPDREFDAATQEEMAKTFHAQYVAGSAKQLPANLRPWERLDETFRRANLEQARYAVEILEAAGFEVRKVNGEPPVFASFERNEVERMAELEHGRWNVERLRDGWRFGPRDDARKTHNYLVSWESLPARIQQYDRDAVRAFPEILAKAGLEVRRRAKST